MWWKPCKTSRDSGPLKSGWRKPTQTKYYCEVRLIDIPKNQQNHTLGPSWRRHVPPKLSISIPPTKHEGTGAWFLISWCCLMCVDIQNKPLEWTKKIHVEALGSKYKLNKATRSSSKQNRCLLRWIGDWSHGDLSRTAEKSPLLLVVHLPLSQTTVFQGVLYFHLLFHCETATNTMIIA